jgi:hypothetical protein
MILIATLVIYWRVKYNFLNVYSLDKYIFIYFKIYFKQLYFKNFLKDRKSIFKRKDFTDFKIRM